MGSFGDDGAAKGVPEEDYWRESWPRETGRGSLDGEGKVGGKSGKGEVEWLRTGREAMPAAIEGKYPGSGEESC